MIITKPVHNKYILSNLNATTYQSYARSYSLAKRNGIRGIYAWSSGAGIFGVVKQISKGTIVQYGKQKIAALCINSAVWISTPAVAVITNSTMVLKSVKQLHTISAFIFECAEDGGNVMFLPIDIAIFGQPIPVGLDNRFNLLSNSTVIFDV